MSAERPTVTRRDALRITALAGISLAFGAKLRERAVLHRVHDTRRGLGTLITLTVEHPDGAEARRMLERAFHTVEGLESILSRHRPGTALSALNRTGTLERVPSELMQVLRAAREVWARSDGAFDPSILPVLTLYEACSREGRLPTQVELRSARAQVGFEGIRLGEDRVEFARPGMGITLDGIAKGYVVDRVVERLVSDGAQRVLVDAGGDMAAGGTTSLREPWRVALQDPRSSERSVGQIALAGTAVATSGDYMRTFSEDRSAHHILDPRTGTSPTEIASVSVTAPSAMLADALSTAALVLGPRDGLRLLERTPHAEGALVAKTGEVSRTSGWAALEL
ncbi:MAG: FAD:protein FMN transferase [Gemmatimonadota bacterium]